MPPDLVIADAPYKVYPGGVIALRASDWLGPARGTLTTEIDTDAITGGVVRDTQTVAASIRTAIDTAYQEADDTLVIPLASLPLEASPTPEMTYALFVSLRTEGDWDVTNADTLILSNQAEFQSSCLLAAHGVGGFTDLTQQRVYFQPRFREHYISTMFGTSSTLFEADVADTLRIRAFAQVGTTIEWLIDQLLLVPFVTSGTHLGQWESDDFEAISGDWARNTSGDGVDGGDINGIYTRILHNEEMQGNWSGGDGGGDYQRMATYAGAEYTFKVASSEGALIENSQTNAEAPAYAYSIAGQNYRPARVHHEDIFDRTVNWPAPTQPGAWETDDRSPEGFGLEARGSDDGGAATYAAVDGAEGIHHLGGQINRAASASTIYGNRSDSALFRMANPTCTGEFYVTGSSTFIGATTQAGVYIRLVREDFSVGSADITLLFDLDAQSWRIVRSTGAAEVTIHGPVDISAWFNAEGNPSNKVGWKVEFRRHAYRVKVWDATAGTEPAAWTAEIFRPYYVGPFPGISWTDYPYTTHASPLLLAGSVNHKYFLVLRSGHETGAGAAITQWETRWTHLKIEEDPYGDPAEVSMAVERPEGTKIGEIVIPQGAQYPIYWGARDWTEDEGGGQYALDFSVRAWNDPAAAELQRIEVPFFWFRSVHGGIVPMNWRSSERPGSVWRVLVGDR